MEDHGGRRLCAWQWGATEESEAPAEWLSTSSLPALLLPHTLKQSIRIPGGCLTILRGISLEIGPFSPGTI